MVTALMTNKAHASLSCLDAALVYAQEGIPVFPVNGKVPYAGTRGFHEASVDLERLTWWWKRWPDANVAVPTGQTSRWIVLDIDGRHGGFASLHHLKAMLQHRMNDFHRMDHVPLLDTLTAQTGSGYHLMFRPPSTQEVRNTTEYAGLPGIDIRGEGGYVVVPPSLHPNGRRYLWYTLISPAPYPPALFHLAEHRKRLNRREAQRELHVSPLHRQSTSSSAEDWLTRAIQRAHVGTRHAYALWLSCRLIEHGLTQQEAEAYIHRYVESVPGGGQDYPLSDALNCLRWASSTAVVTRR